MGSLAKMLLALLLFGYVAATPATAGGISVAIDDFFRDAVPVIGTPPPTASRWIRIIWRRPMTHPVVPVYFFVSKQAVPKKPITSYVTLEPREYAALAKFTYSSTCLPDRGSSESPYIEIDEFAQSRVHGVCVFSRDDGCRYIFGLASLPGIDWSHKDTWPLFQFEAELGCAKPLTPAHDAAGHPQ